MLILKMIFQMTPLWIAAMSYEDSWLRLRRGLGRSLIGCGRQRFLQALKRRFDQLSGWSRYGNVRAVVTEGNDEACGWSGRHCMVHISARAASPIIGEELIDGIMYPSGIGERYLEQSVRRARHLRREASLDQI
jgi:hypothetical protein